MKYIIISFFSILSLFYKLPEPKITYSGVVKDKETGAFISTCKIVVKNSKNGISYETNTDKNGKFKLIINSGNYSLECSKAGYSIYKANPKLNFTKDTTIFTEIIISKKSHTKETKSSVKIKSSKHKAIVAESSVKSYAYSTSELYVGAASVSRGESSYEFSHDLSSERTSYKSAPLDKGLKAGTLTAGEINDFSKWTLWNDLSDGELKNYVSVWGILPKYRFCVLVTNENKNPMNDVVVVLKNSSNEIIWQSKTDNTGKAELWAKIFDTTDLAKNSYKIEANYNGKTHTLSNANIFENGVNKITIKSSCDKKNNVDIVFAVDATGSMGDEIEYLQTELYDVIEKIKSNNKEINLRMGSVFYRDKTDAYLTVEQDLTSDINKVIDFIKAQHADGGGDEPEAVDAALQVAIEKFNWSSEARTRIVFLVLDASPHQEKEVVERIKKFTTMAAKLGVKIVPVVCSGIDKSGEYLMRSIALATNGNYVFLTDNSGIGNPHLAPSTDKYDVETLNNLIVRLIQQYIFVPECNNTVKSDLIDSLQKSAPDSIFKDTSFINSQSIYNDSIKNDKINFLKYYPNPCRDILYVECDGISSEIFITDINGKIIMKIVVPLDEKIIKIDLSQFPAGIYFLKYCLDNKCKAGKFVLIH